MKVKIFMPKYMKDFKCIGPECTDTCCAGWDINIDLNTYNKYINSTNEFKKLLQGKFEENLGDNDFFNKGFMILKAEKRCSFLNDNMLCDIHGAFGENNLCITCKNYPRVFNIVDSIYEKSALPSCPEVCNKAFLNKDKMEFIEEVCNIDPDNIEIRRIIDVEAFEETNSLIKYFWEIRVSSINIMQLRDFSIEKRLTILKSFYSKLQELYESENFNDLEILLEDFNEDLIDYSDFNLENLNEDNNFFISLGADDFIENIKSSKLRDIAYAYKSWALDEKNLYEFLKKDTSYLSELNSYSYIIENYLVNQIFKNIFPFNKGENLTLSLNELINTYKIIKAYVIGTSIISNKKITDTVIIEVIQALSKDIEHNAVFKEILNS